MAEQKNFINVKKEKSKLSLDEAKKLYPEWYQERVVEGRPKKSLNEVIREDLKVVGLTENLVQDKKLWRDRIRILDRRELTL